MQVRLTDGTVKDVVNAEGRRLIREGNARAVEATVIPSVEAPAEAPAEDAAQPVEDTPKHRKRA